MGFSAESEGSQASYARLYATDASVYEQIPSGVAFPRTVGDCIDLVDQARENDGSLIGRGGGTSIAGQCVGGGMVIDLSRHMTGILSAPEDGAIWVQPGVVLDDLNDYLQPFCLHFPIDISTSSRCTIGGMVGNNAAGSHSIVYGTTRDNVLAVDVVLADGSAVRFEALDALSLQQKLKLDNAEGEIYRKVVGLIGGQREAILAACPDASVIRRNTGYALDVLARGQPWVPDGPALNLASLICGSEGTLALITAIQLELSPLVGGKALLCAHFDSVDAALRANVDMLEQPGVAASELIDDKVLHAATVHPGHQAHGAWVVGNPGSVLAVEFFGDSAVDALCKAKQAADSLKAHGIGTAWPVLQGLQAQHVWALRKAGLGLIMGVRQRTRPVAVIEDSAVPVQSLPAFAADIAAMMQRHGVDCVYYGHASVGLLHLRPALDLDDEGDVAVFRALAEETAELVKRYRGSLSGEHGDGRLRAPYLRRFLGKEAYALLVQVKHAFDPSGVFNPGKIISGQRVDADLRQRPRVDAKDVHVGFDWRKDNGFDLALERCNGSGNCRQGNAHGAMCPTFQVTGDELYSTRGRANLLRQAFSQAVPNALNDPVLVEAMDTCLGCKACRNECPSSVDMTRMKAEYLYRRQQRAHVSLRTRLIKHHRLVLSILEKFPAGMRMLLGRLLRLRVVMHLTGLRRELPMPALETLRRYGARSGMETTGGPSVLDENGRVLLLIDPLVNFVAPEIGEATFSLLQRLGYFPEFLYMDCSLRLLISEGCLDEARQGLRRLLVDLSSWGDVPIIGLEPAELLLLREEAPTLLGTAWPDELTSRCYLLDEFLSREHAAKRLPRLAASPLTIDFHPHCHERVISSHHATIKMLADVFGVSTNVISTGCCGMGGFFGYQRSELSASIFANNVRIVTKCAPRVPLVVSGGSCRHQFSDLGSVKPMHLSQLLLGILSGDLLNESRADCLKG